MKKTILGLGAYIFGAIAIVFFGMFIGTEGAANSYRMVVLISGTIGLVLYWKS